MMTSSAEDAIRLLNKWKNDESLILVSLSDNRLSSELSGVVPSPDFSKTPTSFVFELNGFVRNVSDSSLEISSSIKQTTDGNGRLVISIIGASFTYSEPQDISLPFTDTERKAAGNIFRAVLLITFPDKTCLLCEFETT
jgi:hypothetical protein